MDVESEVLMLTTWCPVHVLWFALTRSGQIFNPLADGTYFLFVPIRSPILVALAFCVVGAKVQKVEKIRTSPSKPPFWSKSNPAEDAFLDFMPEAFLRVEWCSGTLFLPACAGWQVRKN